MALTSIAVHALQNAVGYLDQHVRRWHRPIVISTSDDHLDDAVGGRPPQRSGEGPAISRRLGDEGALPTVKDDPLTPFGRLQALNRVSRYLPVTGEVEEERRRLPLAHVLADHRIHGDLEPGRESYADLGGLASRGLWVRRYRPIGDQ